MKKFSGDGPTPPLDKATARACLVANLLALPGLGTIAAGRKGVGYAQAALALLGFAGTLGWLLLFGWEWVERGELPLEFNGILLLGLGSVVAFVGAWLWALQTSLEIQRAARPRTDLNAVPPRLDEAAPAAPPILPPAPEGRRSVDS